MNLIKESYLYTILLIIGCICLNIVYNLWIEKHIT